jgi:uncharacterized protein (DUF2344 family)
MGQAAQEHQVKEILVDLDLTLLLKADQAVEVVLEALVFLLLVAQVATVEQQQPGHTQVLQYIMQVVVAVVLIMVLAQVAVSLED